MLNISKVSARLVGADNELGSLNEAPNVPNVIVFYLQCDQKKIAKCLYKLHKNGFKKVEPLTPLQKLPKNEEHFGKIVVAKGLKQLLKVQ